MASHTAALYESFRPTKVHATHQVEWSKYGLSEINSTEHQQAVNEAALQGLCAAEE